MKQPSRTAFHGRSSFRPCQWLFFALILSFLLDASLAYYSARKLKSWRTHDPARQIATAALGLTDICVATEARYTRHPLVSDQMAPFMDHPGALEHFPTGSFWAPTRLKTNLTDF